MIISVNWLKKFTNIDMSIDELATLIGARLVEIEEVIDLGAKYKDVVIVRVIDCGPLEGTDHLNLTKIDDGGKVTGVERDANGLVQVVCGAPNVRAGMLAAWLPPASTVPETFGDAEPFVLSAKSLRGTLSNGMLASAKELDLFDDHSGIVEIDADHAPGSSFAEAYELDDYLLDIENKSLTHRPDTFGIIGFAREVAAISGHNFVTPEWLAHTDPSYGDLAQSVDMPEVTIDDPDLSDRYQAVVLSGIDTSRQTPLLIQTYLARVGVRPISAVVDVTNYLMMLTGQPLHAFDYDKLVAVAGGKPEIHVRAGRDLETLELLDGRSIELTVDDIVITAGETAVGLAGAMGGASTEIDNDTKNVIIESATFNLYKLRATQMRHGIFSEAITRFTKGQPAELSAPVLADAIELLSEWTGAHRASDVADAVGTSQSDITLTISVTYINDVLGTNLAIDDIQGILESIEFAVAASGTDELTVSPPYWRADIHRNEDIVEEVGRIAGFDSIKPTLPLRDFTATAPSDFDDLRRVVRDSLVRGGANEVLTYSFVHGDVLKKAGQDSGNSYRITNSISPDLQYYRQSLTPNLLGLVHPNIKQGYDKFAVFEINKTHQKSLGMTDESVPVEQDQIALVVASKKSQVGTAYYQAKKYLDYLAQSLGIELAYESLPGDDESANSAPFEHRRSARVNDKVTGEVLGVIGEYKRSVVRAFKLPDHVAGFELDLRALSKVYKKNSSGYTPISRYPGTDRDICFQVNQTTNYAHLASSVDGALKDVAVETSILPIDIYQPEHGDVRNITIRIRLTSHEKTLTTDEVSVIIDGVVSRVKSDLEAIVI